MTKRLNVTMSDEFYDRVVILSKETGLTLSAVCTMAIMNYFEQQRAISAMDRVGALYKKLEDIEKKIEEK